MDLHLRGKRVLITGASKGIGAAGAEVFAEEGCDVVIAARDGALLEQVSQRLRSAYQVNVTPHVVDLRDGAALARLAEAAWPFDILVNNAGDIPQGTIETLDEARWRHAWELKVFGYINLTRLVYSRMKAQGHGVIVNILGAAGERLNAGYIAGSTGNAGLMAFTRTLGSRSLSDNIRVVGINPGPVETDRMTTRLKHTAKERFGDEARWRELIKGYPLGRAANPREIADMMAFLASDRSAYTTGVVMTIDGGLTAGGGAM
ncbi:SDR family oxidoreductase [Bradyrhizobium sp. LHD-71]|uniref:SDR family oxidoreductase n=1 Tax=Bradyrhizobium sp. LHD-71 TaxID=3072141 RepID=UPI002810350F|nr:SDR family oxidoreductase [Bradyrhizobium sp. LHD-71]MDQ8728590.1 SDR family oxidoreductase [Bradyrhizobium sp. LHD-71]